MLYAAKILAYVTTPLALGGLALLILYAIAHLLIRSKLIARFNQANSKHILDRIMAGVFGLALVTILLGFILEFRKNTPLEAKQEAILTAKNPTKIEITEARLMSWLGDPEPYLTVKIHNSTDLPAGITSVQLLNGRSFAIGEPVPDNLPNSEALEYPPSRITKTSLKNGFSIEQRGDLDVPTASNSFLESTFGPGPGFYLAAAGVLPNAPNGLVHERPEDHKILNHIYVTETRSIPVGAIIRYKTVLGEDKTLLTAVYLYFVRNKG